MIGSLAAPKIFGAGLLSSIGEAQSCLLADVDKIPLSLDCVDYGYDITEPQPQLFVTPDFDSMNEVLQALASTMAYRRGGRHGLLVARAAKTVNTVELDSGLQIAGVLADFELDDDERPARLEFVDRAQLAYGGEAFDEIPTTEDGFLAIVGNLRTGASSDVLHRVEAARSAVGSELRLEFDSRINVCGRLCGVVERMGQPLVLSFETACVSRGERVFWTPRSGTFHLAVGAAGCDRSSAGRPIANVSRSSARSRRMRFPRGNSATTKHARGVSTWRYAARETPRARRAIVSFNH